jgi:hypothetical protein
MSLEVHVLSDKLLDSIAEWQRAIDGEKFDLKLSRDARLDEIAGFLPARLGERSTGFECVHDDPRELMDAYVEIDLVHPWQHALTLRWGASFAECLAAWMAATAYARAVRGVVVDPQAGKVLEPDGALAITRNLERELPALEQWMRDGRGR